MSSNTGACSIHLGNYIIEIAPGAMQASPQKEKEAAQSPSRPQTASKKHKHSSSTHLVAQGVSVTPIASHQSSTGSAMGSTADMSSNGRGALQFELQWLKFLRDAEEDYVSRLIKSDKQSALSVFEVNVDVYEKYMLRVSGRALAATQYLNLNLTSSLHSDMRIFDTQQEHVPYETLLKEEALERIEHRKERRMRRRMRNRRGTATFGGNQQELAEELQPTIVFNESPTKTPQAQSQHTLFVLHPIAEEHSQLQLSSDQIEDSPSMSGPLRLNSQLNPPFPIQMLDSLNERDGAGDGQDEFIQEDNEDGEFDRAGAGALHDIIVHKPPEEQQQQTMMFGHSREFDETITLVNISPIPTATVTKAPSMMTLPLEEVVQEAPSNDTQQQTQNAVLTPAQESSDMSKPKVEEQDISQPRLEFQSDSLPSQELIKGKQEMVQSQLDKSVEIHQDIAHVQQKLHPVAISNNFDSKNKIKIGEHTIGDPYYSLGDTSLPNNLTANQDLNPATGAQEPPAIQQNQTFELGEQYTINDVTDLDNTNPFREKSVTSYGPPGTHPHQPVHGASDSPHKEDGSFGGVGGGQSSEQVLTKPIDNNLENTFEKRVHSIEMQGSSQGEEIIQRMGGSGPLSAQDRTHDSYQMTQVAQIIKQESPKSHHRSDHTAQNLQPSHILEDHQPTLIQDRSLEHPEITIRSAAQIHSPPLNISMEEEEVHKVEAAVGTSTVIRQESPQRADAKIGDSQMQISKVDAQVGNSQLSIPQNQLIDQSMLANQQNANVGTSALNISRVDEGLSAITRNQDMSKLGSFSPRLANKSLNISREMHSPTMSAQDQSLINTQGYPLPPIAQQHVHKPEKLQITLTAEPDKPIMVEVRGGEKEFVISALTQHLFDILSKPKGLTMIPQPDSNSSCVERSSEDQDQITTHEQLGQLDSKGVFTLNNQAVNTKAKQLKKQMQKEGRLPSVQRNQNRQNGAIFDSVTRQEMYSAIPGIQKGNCNQMTIQENANLSDQGLPEIRPSSKEVIVGSQQTGGDSAFIKINPNNQKSKGSSRSSNNRVSLSPLTASNVEDPKPVDSGHTRHKLKEENIVIQSNGGDAITGTKRTTEEAYAAGKIQQEIKHHTYIDSDGVSANIGQISALGSIPNTLRKEDPIVSTPERQGKASSIESSQQKQQLINMMAHQQESFRKVSSEEALQILQQQQSLARSNDSGNTPTSGKGTQGQLHKSRPETANFNRAFAASQDQVPTVSEQAKQIQQMEEDLEHARQRLSMMIRHENDAAIFSGDQSPIEHDIDGNEAVIQAPETPKYKEDDISIADQQASLVSRLETPGADAQDGIHIQEIINSAPSQLEQINLAPLHPTIPSAHPNGYFSTESDYMMVRPESNTRLRQSNSSEANDQYLKQPKLNYYENQNLKTLQPTIQQTQQTTVTDTFFNSQYGFSDQDQPMNENDFILAEGYPIMNYMQDTRNGTIGQTQYYDFSQSSFTPVLASSHGGNILSASMQNTPNAYRIRKVILPNYPNNSSSLSYGPNDNTQLTGGSPQVPVTNLYPPSHLQSRDTHQKQLPVVKTRKRYFQTTMQNPQTAMNPLIVFQNGNEGAKKGGKEKGNGIQFQGHRSLSPVRVSQKKVFYTTSYMTKKQLLQQLQQEQWLRYQQQSLLSPQNNSTGQLSIDDFQQFAYYSQSPQPRIKASPYMSDDEFKILHDFYNISCEPTGMQRGGLPLMKVKRIHKPKNRNFNTFNFSEDPNNLALPKALSSLQIFYPHFQPNQNEMLSKTLNTPSKWFERFNQSTRNLNNTIHNMHKEHSLGAVPGGAITESLRQRSGSQQALFVKRQTPGASSPGLVENGEFDGYHPQREHTSLPQDIIMTNISHDLGQAKLNGANNRKFFSSIKEGNTSTYMPPLKKIYTQTMKDDHHQRDKYTRNTGGTQKKGTKLPPKPFKQKGGVPIANSPGLTNGTTHTSASQAFSGKKDRSLSGSQKQVLMSSSHHHSQTEQQQPVIQIPPNSIIYANHNQQVCFGVNIITKSDK